MALRITDLTNIPTKPGVYIFSDGRGKILYIGKAKNLKNRLAQYFQKGSVRKQDMLQNAIKVEFHIVTTESEALFLEDNLIKKHVPPYNSLLKADNSYAYIKITNEEYPQIFLTRFRDNDGSTYLGPKSNTRHVREMLHFFRQLFQYRGCKKVQFNEGKLCSDYFFGLCEGWCVYSKLKTQNENLKMIDLNKLKALNKKTKTNPPSSGSDDTSFTKEASSENRYLAEAKRIGFVEKYTYDESKKNYKKILGLLTDFFGGRVKTLKDYIMERLEDAIKKQHFEYAAQIRDMYGKIDLVTERQNVVLSRPVTGNIVEVKKIGEWRVCCMVKLYEGKIIDIIRYKQHQSDGDVSSLLSSFNREVAVLGWNYLENGKLTACADIVACDEKMGDNVVLIGIDTDKRILNEALFEIIALLERSIDAYVLTSAFEKDNLMNELLKTLETRYGFRKFPYSVECLDISHLSGGWVSGGLSAIKEGLPNKKSYRRYKIKGTSKKSKEQRAESIDIEQNPHPHDVEGAPLTKEASYAGYEEPMIQSDDYASLTEVLTRRFNLQTKKSKEQRAESIDNEDGEIQNTHDQFFPDVFILDGGKGQLGILRDLYKDSETFRDIYEKVHFVSLGKGEARERRGKTKGAKEKIYMFDENFKIIEKELCYDDADRVLTSLRDEAHRFANAYRKKQMSSERSNKKIKTQKAKSIVKDGEK